MRFRNTFFVALLSYVSNNAFADVQVTSGTISVAGSTMHIKGDITPKLAQEFRLVLTSQIKTIVITSRGGHTRASLEMAELMLDKKLTLIVEKECASACANLFLAAERKIVKPGGYVGWHGGAVNALPYIADIVEQALVGKMDKSITVKLAQLLKSEIDFYRRVGVDIDFVYYSGIVSPSIQNKQIKPRNYLIDGQIVATARTMPRKYELWVPDLTQMEASGIKNIVPFSYPKNKQAVKKYFNGINVYMGKAYTYYDAKHLKSKKSSRFDWGIYHKLQMRVERLMAIVQCEVESPSVKDSGDQLDKKE